PQISDGRFSDAPIRTAVVGRFLAGPSGEGWSNVAVAQTRHARSAMAWSLMEKTGALVLFVGALGFVASIVAARRALLPLARIEKALAGRDVQDFTRLDVDSPRETQALVDAINALMARFSGQMAKLHTFIAVAAHQIRTPLAALNAQIELLDN